jgi:glycogen(starch) synthase
LAKAIPYVLRKFPDVRFVLAGKSQVSPFSELTPRAFTKGEVCFWQDMDQWLRKRLAKYGESVEFRGLVDAEGIKTLLAGADLCVFPSRFDNFPNACLEAMAAARPIVATRSGGMEEMLGPANGGMLVAPGDHKQLAEAICWMIKHPEERRAMAERARAQVCAAYADDVIGPLYERVYREAGERNAASPR